MNEQNLAVARQWRVWNMAILLLSLLTVGGLLIAGIYALGLHRPARHLLAMMLLIALGVDLVRTGVGTAMQYQMVQAVQATVDKQLAEQPDDHQALPMAIIRMTHYSILAGIIFGLGWLLALCGFYLYGFFYLRRPAICAVRAGKRR